MPGKCFSSACAVSASLSGVSLPHCSCFFKEISCLSPHSMSRKGRRSIASTRGSTAAWGIEADRESIDDARKSRKRALRRHSAGNAFSPSHPVTARKRRWAISSAYPSFKTLTLPFFSGLEARSEGRRRSGCPATRTACRRSAIFQRACQGRLRRRNTPPWPGSRRT